MTGNSISIDGQILPMFLYGTAWKEDATKRLTELAVRTGFRGIDTANQRRHYHEAAIGEAVTSLFSAGVVTRSELFLQTKFTFLRSQDQRLPYDPGATIADQVEQSFSSSLEHLNVDRIESFLLHGPTTHRGLVSADWEAWQAMEAIHDSGRTRWLGVSNMNLEQLKLLHDGARIRPRFVQNRCYAEQGWDRNVRQFCLANDIIYQGFSLLTANASALAHPTLARIADSHRRTIAEVVFRFAVEIGILPLTGTTNETHMRSDLDIAKFELMAAEIRQIESILES